MSPAKITPIFAHQLESTMTDSGETVDLASLEDRKHSASDSPSVIDDLPGRIAETINPILSSLQRITGNYQWKLSMGGDQSTYYLNFDCRTYEAVQSNPDVHVEVGSSRQRSVQYSIQTLSDTMERQEYFDRLQSLLKGKLRARVLTAVVSDPILITFDIRVETIAELADHAFNRDVRFSIPDSIVAESAPCERLVFIGILPISNRVVSLPTEFDVVQGIPRTASISMDALIDPLFSMQNLGKMRVPIWGLDLP